MVGMLSPKTEISGPAWFGLFHSQAPRKKVYQAKYDLFCDDPHAEPALEFQLL